MLNDSVPPLIGHMACTAQPKRQICYDKKHKKYEQSETKLF